MKSLRIVMVAACPFPYPRGTPTRIYRMAEALAHRGHDVHVVTYHLGDHLPDPPFSIHRIPRVASYHRTAAGPSYQKFLVLDPLLIWRLIGVLKEATVDILHAHHLEGLLVARAARRWARCPIIYDAHTLVESEIGFYGMGIPRSIRMAVARFADYRLPRRADHIIAVTDTIKEMLSHEARIPEERIDVIMNGVEFQHFDVKPSRTKGCETPLKNVVYAGNLAPYQGVDLLLSAFRSVLNIHPEARLTIATLSPFNEYETMARELGLRNSIDLIPSSYEELPNVLARADVAVNPRPDSRGIPQKLLNYMAAGKPIVSFEGSAVMLEHGLTGWLIPRTDAADLGAGLIRILGDPVLAGRLGRSAREAARAYTWENVARSVEAVYDLLIR